MCGIAGAIGTDLGRTRNAAAQLAAAMPHRGPDDDGIVDLPGNKCAATLAFRRLAILDLTPFGHQPMSSTSGDWLVFNGEIYNAPTLRAILERDGHVFRGRSDSEVLLAALCKWGVDALPRLAGMYAFAFYSSRARSLLLARDPLGIKPLYIGYTPQMTLFASEIQAIRAAPDFVSTVDPDGITNFLQWGCLQDSKTLYKGIDSLPAGSYAWIDLQSTSLTPVSAIPYWTFPQPATGEASRLSLSDATHKLRETFDTVVSEHLLADVPLGVFLSAGIDSTVLAAVAASHTSHLRTFTVGLCEKVEDDELALAAETARRLRCHHTELLLDAQGVEASWAHWIDAMDSPSIDGLNVFVISQAVRAEGIKVALSGLGADELFAGYPSFSRAQTLRRLLPWLTPLPKGLRSLVADCAARFSPHPHTRERIRSLLLRAQSPLDAVIATRTITPDSVTLELGLPPKPLHYVGTVTPDIGKDVGQAVSVLESEMYMRSMLLRDSDSNSMQHSLELRVPFLDRRIADFAYSLPDTIRMPDGSPPKALLREAFADLIPDAVARRDKTGFTLPIATWMRTSMREWCEDAITRLTDSGLLNPEGVRSVWNNFIHQAPSRAFAIPLALVILGRKVSATPSQSGQRERSC
jgi:asparagine synthase (glutamine-hydrolysing)